jgi:integrase
MSPAELSEDLATWSIPGTRTKNRRPHFVPLAPFAQEILAPLRKSGSDREFMFSTTGGISPVSGFSKIKCRLDQKMKIPHWRLHDLRRTAATGMAEIGVAPHIVEATLNHISGAKAGVAGTYNRATYAVEKRVALEQWAAHVDAVVNGRAAKVISLIRSA